MRKMLIVLVAAGSLAGCTTAERDAAAGAAAGAAIGGLVSGRVEGVVVGAFIGAAGGVLLGHATRTGYCQYRGRNGRIFTKPCPAGY
ncbi:MAG: glycine zipper domain-containing protein [Rhizobiaceae bacterium]